MLSIVPFALIEAAAVDEKPLNVRAQEPAQRPIVQTSDNTPESAVSQGSVTSSAKGPLQGPRPESRDLQSDELGHSPDARNLHTAPSRMESSADAVQGRDGVLEEMSKENLGEGPDDYLLGESSDCLDAIESREHQLNISSCESIELDLQTDVGSRVRVQSTGQGNSVVMRIGPVEEQLGLEHLTPQQRLDELRRRLDEEHSVTDGVESMPDGVRSSVTVQSNSSISTRVIRIGDEDQGE